MKTLAEARGSIVLPSQVAPGSTLRGLVLQCAQCTNPVPLEEFRDGLCLHCATTRKCKDLRDELVRLYKKRERLIKVGANPKPTDEQAIRVRRRIVKVISALTGNQKRVEELVNEQGKLAREQALANSRIRLPAFGR